jgi:hypothetical protein
MTKLLAGVLCFSLVVLFGVAKAGDSAVPMKPGTLIIIGEEKQPGGSQFLAYAWDGKAKRPSLLFRKRSKLCGDLHAFAVGRDGRQYYLNKDNYLIVQADKTGENEQVIFRHQTYVRDLALDNDDNLYFSEASGAGGDGRIYRLRLPRKVLPSITKGDKDKAGSGAQVKKPDPASKLLPSIIKGDKDKAGSAGQVKQPDPAPKGEQRTQGQTAATAELFCTVRLQDMSLLGPNSGFWAGNFAFARDAKGMLDTNTLYLSSGNISTAAIFRMTRKDGKWSKPKPVFVTNAPIMGLVFTNPREAYCVRTQGLDGIKQVFRLTDLRKAEAVLSLDVRRVWHLSVVPRAAEEKRDLRKSSPKKQ